MSDEAVYRTAPATQGLLNTFISVSAFLYDPYNIAKHISVKIVLST